MSKAGIIDEETADRTARLLQTDLSVYFNSGLLNGTGVGHYRGDPENHAIMMYTNREMRPNEKEEIEKIVANSEASRCGVMVHFEIGC